MKIQRGILNNHDCILSLKAKLHRQNEKLKLSDQEKKNLKSDLEALREHTIRINATTCEIFEVTCKLGHPVRR